MKNPFERRDNTVLVASVVVGSVAVGAAAYFLLSEAGTNMRERFNNQFSRVRSLFGGATPQAAYAYKSKKATKTNPDTFYETSTTPDNNEVTEE